MVRDCGHGPLGRVLRQMGVDFYTIQLHAVDGNRIKCICFKECLSSENNFTKKPTPNEDY